MVLRIKNATDALTDIGSLTDFGGKVSEARDARDKQARQGNLQEMQEELLQETQENLLLLLGGVAAKHLLPL